MTSEFRNGAAGIFGARDVSDSSDIKRHRWDMRHEARWAVNKGLWTWSAEDGKALQSKVLSGVPFQYSGLKA